MASRPDQVKGQLFFEGYTIGPRCVAGHVCTPAIALAILIIGCLGAAGVIPGSQMGWITMGLAASGGVIFCCAGTLRHRKIELLHVTLATAAFVTLGVLGGQKSFPMWS